MTKNHIYLDYNATAPLHPAVLKVMTDIIAQPHNASAVHGFGREGRRLVENARESVAALVGTTPNQVIFNSGATEGNNTVLQFFAQNPQDRILVSAIEHPSVLNALDNAEHIPVTQDGVVDLNGLEDLLTQKPRATLVSVMLVNNETGIVQPVAEIAALAHRHGALFHCDAVQAAGRIPVNIHDIGIDFLTLSAHKMGGPQGVGALVLGLCGITPTLLQGGRQEKKARAGTENVSGIAGFGEAARQAMNNLASYQRTLAPLHQHLEKELTALNQIHIHGQNSARVPNTTLFSIENKTSDSLLIAFDLNGIAVSNGAACSSGTVQASHVLEAMGCESSIVAGTIRISTGWNTKPEDIDRFLETLKKIL